jgi:hypothetical protein
MQPKQITFRIFICIFFIAFVILIKKYVEIRNAEIKPKEQPTDNVCDTIISYVTLYHPTAEQCGNNKNITFNGDKGHIGGCAVSQKMLDYYCNIGDSIIIDSGTLKGRYIVNDKAGSKTLLVDVWRPVGDSLKDCYKTKILIKRK